MLNTAREGDPCRKCGTELRSILCARCYGTGKSGKRDCKGCSGKGVIIGCPNFRSHRIWPWKSPQQRVMAQQPSSEKLTSK